MARPQEFDHSTVLNSAMQLFWQKGYSSTSIKDLTEVTHLQPGSLYGAFKNKRNLFIITLDYYFAELHGEVSRILQSEEPPLKRIRQFFDFILDRTIKDDELKACLLMNTLLELPPDDEEINHRVSQMFAQIEQAFCETLQQAQWEGSLASGARPESLAKMLLSGVFGLQVYNRMHPDKEELRGIINNLLTVLDS